MDGCEEGRSIGFECRHPVSRKEPEFGSQLGDLLKSRAAFLHIVQLREDISDDGITSLGRDLQNVAVLNPSAVKHSSGRVELDTVIVNIHVFIAYRFYYKDTDFIWNLRDNGVCW